MRSEVGTAEALMTVEEVAEMLRLTKETLYRWSLQGKIPCIRFGRQLRFERRALDKWLGERRE